MLLRSLSLFIPFILFTSCDEPREVPHSKAAQDRGPFSEVLPPIKGADPNKRHDEHFSLPTRLVFYPSEYGLKVGFDSTSARSIRLLVGDKMEVGCSWTISYFDGDSTLAVGPISSGASLRDLLDVPLNYLPNLENAVARLGAVRVVADLVVFETDIPSQHGWQPTSGQYREIWRGQAVGERRRL